jgi:hypothetical protein
MRDVGLEQNRAGREGFLTFGQVTVVAQSVFSNGIFTLWFCVDDSCVDYFEYDAGLVVQPIAQY